jgi:hypothetical protein
MKVSKKQLEALIRESVAEEIESLNEEELQELLGGLKNLFGTGAKAVQGAAQRAGTAVSGAAQKAGTAISGAAGKAAGAVKTAYQTGETQAAKQSVEKSLNTTIQTIDKALQTVGTSDQNLAHVLDNVKAGVESAKDAMVMESRRTKVLRRKTK